MTNASRARPGPGLTWCWKLYCRSARLKKTGARGEARRDRQKRRQLVEAGGLLPGLPAQFQGLQCRRHRRPERHTGQAGIFFRTRRGRAVDQPFFQKPNEGFRVRHLRLQGCRPHLRKPRGFPINAGGGSRTRATYRRRPGRQPFIGRAPLVQSRSLLEN